MASGGWPTVRAMWSTHISATIMACAGQDVKASEGLKVSPLAQDRTAQACDATALLYTAPGSPAKPAAAPQRLAGRPTAEAGARSAGPPSCSRPHAAGARRAADAGRACAVARWRRAVRRGASARVGLSLAHAPVGRRIRGRRCWTPGSCGTRGPPRAGWGSCTCAPRRAPGSARRPAPAPLSPVKCHAPTSRWRSRPPRGGARIAGRQRAALQPDRS